MQIFGIGIDIVEVDRIQASIEKFGDTFLNKIFSPLERAYCDSQKLPHINYAARFASKEAIAKSFGTGIGKHLSWLDMTILKKSDGSPSVEFHGTSKDFIAKHEIIEVKISLTHTKVYAAANALALSKQ